MESTAAKRGKGELPLCSCSVGVIKSYCFVFQDEKRLAIKKAKEDLEKWLQDHPKMKPGLKYMRAREIFNKEPVWQAVHEDDRQDIFREALVGVSVEFANTIRFRRNEKMSSSTFMFIR